MIMDRGEQQKYVILMHLMSESSLKMQDEDEDDMVVGLKLKTVKFLLALLFIFLLPLSALSMATVAFVVKTLILDRNKEDGSHIIFRKCAFRRVVFYGSTPIHH